MPRIKSPALKSRPDAKPIDFASDGPGQFNLESVELWVIDQALAYFKGKKIHAAASLGISIRTLRIKVGFYDCLTHWRSR